MPGRSSSPPLSRTKRSAPVDIADNDPLLAYLQSASGAVDVEALELDSPALTDLRAAGVKLAVPLVSQGELIGVLYLGPRRSEQEYSSDDRRLLDNLAAQAAPALRVGQLVRQQKAEAATRERFEAELEVARLIQQNFLPKKLPELTGWEVAAHYRPAREVGGDFYDVIPLPDDQVGFVIGDVTDKGVPAALVMAATRSVLRASAQRLVEPSEVLERVNEHLCPDMPAKMFVTCLYGVLEPASGRFRFANAGHDLPYVKTAGGSVELRARGMPLGLMVGMAYEQKETVLEPGDSLLLHSDGIVEAHDPQGRMYGFPRLKEVVGTQPGGGELIDFVLRDLAEHIGPGVEQEDDITMVTVQRAASAAASRGDARDGGRRRRAARRDRRPQRRGQRAARDGGGRRPGRGSRDGAGAARPAPDRRRRGDHERDGARQPLRRRPPRHRAPAVRRGRASGCRSSTRGTGRRPTAPPRCRTSRRSSPACSGRGDGACSSSRTWSTRYASRPTGSGTSSSS